jgi:adhesin transport system membrane fusion protein
MINTIVYFMCFLIVTFAGSICVFSYDVVVTGEARIEVQSKNRPIQHLEGGVVGDIRVTEGDTVQVGQVLAIVNAGVQNENEVELRAEREAVRIRLVRLIAEEKGERPSFGSLSGGVFSRFASNEMQLGEARRRELDTILEQYRDRISQSEIKVKKNKLKEESVSARILLLMDKFEASKRLLNEKLITKFEVLGIEDELESLKSRREDLNQEILIEEKIISELQYKQREVVDGFKNDLAKDIRDAEVQLERIDQRLNPLFQRSDRKAVVSPVDGVVKALNIASVGDVVVPGAVIAEVVPVSDGYVANVLVSPADIVDVVVGQKADLVLDAYNQFEFGSISAIVESVSVDTVSLETSSGEFYKVRLLLGSLESRKGGVPFRVMAGMSGTAYFKNGKRPLYHYIFGEVLDAFTNARTGG